MRTQDAQQERSCGQEMSERTMTDASYRYAFNGKEKDVSGLGDQTHYDYGFRIYNPEIARFLSVDPLTGGFPFYTPYQFAGNTPIQAIDLDGAEAFGTNTYLYLRSKWLAFQAKLNNSQRDVYEGIHESNPTINRLPAHFNKKNLHKYQVISGLASATIEPTLNIISAPMRFVPGMSVVELTFGRDLDGNEVAAEVGVAWVIFDIATMGEGKAAVEAIEQVVGKRAMNNLPKFLDELQEIADNLRRKHPGKGPENGKVIHKEFEKQVNKLGYEDVNTEINFLEGEVVRGNKKGSSRIDVFVGDIEKSTNGVSLDLKTGKAKVGKEQAEKKSKNTGATSTIEIKPTQDKKQ